MSFGAVARTYPIACSGVYQRSFLSEAKNKNYVYSGNDANLYDWEFQIVYDELMVEELKSSISSEPDADNTEPLSMAMDYYKLINLFSKKLGRVMSRNN